MAGKPSGGWNYLDKLSQGLIVIDFDHHKDHDGKAFVVTGQATLDSAGVLNLLVVTPAGPEFMHLLHQFRSTGEANLAHYEATAVSANGTGLAEINRNRNSANVSGAAVYQGPTVTDAGTLLMVAHFGSGQNEGGDTRGDNEWVLKPSTNYLLRVTSEANGNDVSWYLNWYEHDGTGDE